MYFKTLKFAFGSLPSRDLSSFIPASELLSNTAYNQNVLNGLSCQDSAPYRGNSHTPCSHLALQLSHGRGGGWVGWGEGGCGGVGGWGAVMLFFSVCPMYSSENYPCRLVDELLLFKKVHCSHYTHMRM